MNTAGKSWLSDRRSFGGLRTVFIAAWSVLAIIAGVLECLDNREFRDATALATARSSIEKDIMFRRWASGHGGVYVPVTDKTPPNPWLVAPERDIATPSGRQLTLINPAYMTRQIFEIAGDQHGHITSLKPLNPANAADPWESRALAAFETGTAETGEFIAADGAPVYRYMRPLIVEQTCLKCHASQGYRLGMVRGGISIAIPVAGLEQAMRQSNRNHLGIIAAIWLCGVTALLLGFRRISDVTAELKTERDNLDAIFNANPVPVLLFENQRLEVVRDNRALREYCVDNNRISERSCGVLLNCVNAKVEPGRCGDTPECEKCGLLRALRLTVGNGRTSGGETAITRCDEDGVAREYWFLYSTEGVMLDGRGHTILSFMDISANKQLEAELIRQTEFLEDEIAERLVVQQTLEEHAIRLEEEIEGHRKTQEVLHVREQEFRTLAENSPDNILRYDRARRVTYANRNMLHTMGKAAGDTSIVGKKTMETWPGGYAGEWQEECEQYLSALDDVITTGAMRDVERHVTCPGGSVQIHAIRITAERDDEGVISGALAFGRDITRQRNLEIQLRHAQKMQAIGTLAGGVAHDFNNILTVIAGYTELLGLACAGNMRTQSYLDEIAGSVSRAAELVRSLLTFSGKHEPQMQPNDLNRIVTGLQKTISRLIRSDITLTFTVHDAGIPIIADHFQIEQVLINLLVNARDSLGDNGRITVVTRIATLEGATDIGTTTIPPGHYGVVTVSDNGCGMSRETMARIFDPFFTTKEPGKGTGLGLAIVGGIIDSHKGYISAVSTPGQGSEFSVYLPVCDSDDRPAAASHKVTTSLNGTETILLVEDNSTVRAATTELLQFYGYSVLAAADGMSALEIFAEQRDRIAIAVVDMIMPRMNGLETMKRLRLLKPDLPLIIASGYYEGERGDIAELGAVYLTKPVHPETLAAAVRVGIDGVARHHPDNGPYLPSAEQVV